MTILSLVQKAVAQTIAAQAAWTEIEQRGEAVDEYRKYFDGNHPANLTDEMRKLLRTTRKGSEFTDNYCQRVVHSRADRCIVTRIEADNDAGTQWVQSVLDFSRFDALQMDVHEAPFRDGDTYVMTAFDNNARMPYFTHELAYDGTSGVIPIYKSADSTEMDCVIKVWHVLSEDGKHTDVTRINVYYPDRIEKFTTSPDGLIHFFDPTALGVWPIAWVDSAGAPLGIPFVHFKNQGRQNFGLSVLEKILGLQDALNRSLHSLVMAGELTAFQIIAAIGFDPPDEITPGSFLVVSPGGLTTEDQVEIKPIPAGSLDQLLALANWLKYEIHNVSNTPNPEQIGTNISGEALKQHEVFMIGEIRRFEVKAGECWEQCLTLAHRIAQTFGGVNVPDILSFRTKWDSPEIRDIDAVLDAALKVQNKISDEEFLRLVAQRFDWDETKITKILAERRTEQAAKVTALAGNMPGFGN